MRIRVVTDGNPRNTEVFDAETGAKLPKVYRVAVEIDRDGIRARVIIGESPDLAIEQLFDAELEFTQPIRVTDPELVDPQKRQPAPSLWSGARIISNDEYRELKAASHSLMTLPRQMA